MPPIHNNNRLWTVVVLENKLFAIPVEYVQTMVTLPDVASIPNAPDHVRGVINLRGAVMSVVDLRVLLGMPSVKMEVENLVEMLNQREKDHIKGSCKNNLNKLSFSRT